MGGLRVWISRLWRPRRSARLTRRGRGLRRGRRRLDRGIRPPSPTASAGCICWRTRGAETTPAPRVGYLWSGARCSGAGRLGLMARMRRAPRAKTIISVPSRTAGSSAMVWNICLRRDRSAQAEGGRFPPNEPGLDTEADRESCERAIGGGVQQGYAGAKGGRGGGAEGEEGTGCVSGDIARAATPLPAEPAR